MDSRSVTHRSKDLQESSRILKRRYVSNAVSNVKHMQNFINLWN